MTELSSDARSLLARARAAHEPRPSDQERVRQALALRLAGGVALAASTTSAASVAQAGTSAGSAAGAGTAAGQSSVGGLMLLKATLGGVLLGTLTMAGVGAVTSKDTAELARGRVSVSAREARAEPRAANVAESPNPGPDPARPPPNPGVPMVSGTATPRVSRGLPVEAPLPGRGVEREGIASGDLNTGRNAVGTSSSVAAFSEPAAFVGGASAAREAPRPPGDSERLTAEARALAEVQRALDQGSPAVALELLSRHERTFAGGALGQERAAARVFVLCALGRKLEAQREGARFLAAAPQSPLAARVKAACSPLGRAR
jgi:hypothetical protein